METLFPSLVATGFEVFAAIVSAAVYLAVGAAALGRAPRDVRARLFFVIALASAVPYSFTVLLWARGANATLTAPVIGMVVLSLMIGSLTLFHFSQVFPWRRPWIRAYWIWLLAAYVIVPVAVAIPFSVLSGLAVAVDESGSGGLGAVSAGVKEGLILLMLVIPTLFLLGLVLPFGALMSLYKTWLETKAKGAEAARITIFWILISQMAGGVLAILVIPLLRLVAPGGPWVTIAAVLLFAFGLLMPLAFAAGVWKYRVLELDPEIPPAGFRAMNE